MNIGDSSGSVKMALWAQRVPRPLDDSKWHKKGSKVTKKLEDGSRTLRPTRW